MLRRKRCLLLGTLFLWVAFPAWPETHRDRNPQVVVSVYDDADVLPDVLLQAEQEAATIFDRAGIEVIWANCSSPTRHVDPGSPVAPGLRTFLPVASEARHVQTQTATGIGDSGCARFDWPTFLAVRIVPRSKRYIDEVFGVAFLSAEGTGCYSDIFYDRATELHHNWGLDLAEILGNVMAHELGHLLLGLNSHGPSGIMKARWQGEDLRHLEKSSLRFTAEEAERMRGKLIAAEPTIPPRLVLAARSGY